MKEPFLSDAPTAGDELNRRPFAERVAWALTTRAADASMVLGIHSTSGEGKTTILQFVADALRNLPRTICVEFNPWRIDAGADLPGALLATLADALHARLGGEPSPAQIALGEYAKFLAGNTSDAGIDPASSVQWSAARTKADQALIESGIQFVVLIDDADRIDGPRLLALARLLKMTADFRPVSYVLAGDDAAMAAAVAMATGSADAGRDLLEKTIQVTLHVPKADPDLIRDFFLLRLKAALDPTMVIARSDAEARFSEMFTQGLRMRLKTIRAAKRCINSLAFSLSMLKSQVNTVDLIVIEGIRLPFPNLHRAIRENRDDFLWYRISRDGPDADNRATELMRAASTGLNPVETEAMLFLVRSLFPAFDRTRHPSRGDIERWGDDKRICSPEHFDRFFDYGGKEVR